MNKVYDIKEGDVYEDRIFGTRVRVEAVEEGTQRVHTSNIANPTWRDIHNPEQFQRSYIFVP